MIAALTTAGSAIANSRALQIAIIGALFIVLFLLWLKGRDDQIRKMERMIGERQARLKQDHIRKENAKKSKQVADARESAPRGITNADELRDTDLGWIVSDN
ncbi:MAG: hypothetical protein MK130_08975 [Puniceicoccaceae bacterium]|nr:hypothetical protein [Puniceicoccaceae bacterium]